MPQFAIIDAPSILGMRPTGVEHLPEALRAAGLLTDLRGEYADFIITLQSKSGQVYVITKS
jgi:hypothetical protein